MLHTTYRIETCVITRALSFADYLDETDSDTELTESKRYLARVEAKTSGTAGAPLEGVDADALALLSQYIGSNVSCLISCESADGLAKAVAAVNGIKGKKVPFTIYEAEISDVLAELGKTGIAIRNEETRRRYSRLSRSYFGNLGESRSEDAANAFVQDIERMLDEGWVIVGENKETSNEDTKEDGGAVIPEALRYAKGNIDIHSTTYLNKESLGICPKCNRENEDGAMFCRYCGSSMNPDYLYNSGILSVSYAEPLVVLHTRMGYASGIAADLKQRQLGTVAGIVADVDTIFVARADGSDWQQFLDELSDALPALKSVM